MTMENINISTSRKNEGATVHNMTAVRRLVEQAKYLGKSSYIITDDGGNLIYVDIDAGVTGSIIEVVGMDGTTKHDVRWYEDGATSSKRNGYVYTPLTIRNRCGELTTIFYGTHSIVCMLAKKADFDFMINCGINPVCNHRNNKSWDNRKDNLEWISQRNNIRHGKIIASLYHYFGRQYVNVEHNMSRTRFMVLKQPLCACDIENYLSYVGNKFEFKCASNEYIDPDVVEAFVYWLCSQHIWDADCIK